MVILLSSTPDPLFRKTKVRRNASITVKYATSDGKQE